MLWGIILVVIGFVMILNHAFGINLHLGRIIVASVFIYIGASMLFGFFGWNWTKNNWNSNASMFSTGLFEEDKEDEIERRADAAEREADAREQEADAREHEADRQVRKHHKGDRVYKTLFGESTLDFTDIELGAKGVDLDVKTVFGETKLIVKKGTPLRLHTNTVFGNSTLPGKNLSALGKFNYQTDGLGGDAPALNINSDVIFGSFRVIER